MDSDNSRDSGGDFRRSASARLPRNKNRGVGGDALNNTFNEESGDSGRSGEQVGVSFLCLWMVVLFLFTLPSTNYGSLSHFTKSPKHLLHFDLSLCFHVSPLVILDVWSNVCYPVALMSCAHRTALIVSLQCRERSQ